MIEKQHNIYDNIFKFCPTIQHIFIIFLEIYLLNCMLKSTVLYDFLFIFQTRAH